VGWAQALSKACAPVGLVRVRVGAVVPRVRADNVFTTKLTSSITTVLIDNSGPREILTIQDGCAHEGHWGLPVQRCSPSNRTLGYRRAVCRLGEGRSTRVTLRA
jgi:hypothetical protein